MNNNYEGDGSNEFQSNSSTYQMNTDHPMNSGTSMPNQNMNGPQQGYFNPNQTMNGPQQGYFNPNQTMEGTPGYTPNGYPQYNANPMGNQPGGYPPYNQQQNQYTSNTKKSHKWIYGLSAIPVVAILAVLAFFFIPSFQNFIYKNVLGTEKYYAHIESSCNEKLADDITSLFTSEKYNTTTGFSANGSASLNLDSSLTEDIPYSISDFSLNYKTAVKDNKSSVSYSLSYQGTELGVVELYSNLDDNSIYLRIPTLSDQYIDYTGLISALVASEEGAVTDITSDSSILNMSMINTSSATEDIYNQMIENLYQELDPDTVTAIATDYKDFLLDQLKEYGDIELTENTAFQVSGSVQTCDAFTITISEQDARDIVINVLEKAQTDDTLLTIIKNVMGTDLLYSTELKSLISELEDAEIDTTNDEFLSMIVYTDGNEILGRNFTLSVEGEDLSFLYGAVSNDSDYSCIVEISSSDSAEDHIGMSIDGTNKTGSYDGSINFYAEEQAYTIAFTDFSVNSDDLVTGIFTFPIDTETTITAKFSATDNVQTSKISVASNGTDLGDLSIVATLDSAKDFTYPTISEDSIASITDSASLASYLENSNLEAELQLLINTFNLPSDLSASELAEQLINQIKSSTWDDYSYDDSDDSYDYYDYDDSDDSDDSYDQDNSSSGNYSAEDYNLPSGTSIDSYGYYTYDLTDSDLAAIKASGSDYENFNKSYTEMSSYFETLATTVCGTSVTKNEDTMNYVSGNVEYDYSYSYHYSTVTWYSSDSDNYLSVMYDTVNDQVFSVTIFSNDTANLTKFISNVCSNLELTDVPSDTMSAISTIFDNKTDCSESYTIGDNILSVYSSEYSDPLSYSVCIETEDNIY